MLDLTPKTNERSLDVRQSDLPHLDLVHQTLQRVLNLRKLGFRHCIYLTSKPCSVKNILIFPLLHLSIAQASYSKPAHFPA